MRIEKGQNIPTSELRKYVEEAIQNQKEGKDFAEAKRENTKLSRIEKIIPMVKAGKGRHDKYKNC